MKYRIKVEFELEKASDVLGNYGTFAGAGAENFEVREVTDDGERLIGLDEVQLRADEEEKE